MLSKITPIRYAIGFSLADAAGAIVFTTIINWTQPDNTHSFVGLVVAGFVMGFMAGFAMGKMLEK